MTDLREAARALLDGLWSKEPGGFLIAETEDVEALRAALDQPEEGWVSVEERLPENSLRELLLWIGADHEDHGLVVGCYYDGRWHNDGVGEITHWRPLPPGPED